LERSHLGFRGAGKADGREMAPERVRKAFPT
jgi:hypothetical protein